MFRSHFHLENEDEDDFIVSGGKLMKYDEDIDKIYRGANIDDVINHLEPLTTINYVNYVDYDDDELLLYDNLAVPVYAEFFILYRNDIITRFPNDMSYFNKRMPVKFSYLLDDIMDRMDLLNKYVEKEDGETDD